MSIPDRCLCDEWAPNIAKVNAPFLTAFARNPLTAVQYDGPQFRFCPWCGSQLRDVQATDYLPDGGASAPPEPSA